MAPRLEEAMAEIFSKANCPVVGDTQQSYEEAPRQRGQTERSQTAPPGQPWEWATWEVDPPAPINPSDDSSPPGFDLSAETSDILEQRQATPAGPSLNS